MNKAYSRINWQNAPSEATALNETNLNKMDSAIDVIDDRVVAHDTRLDNAEYAIGQAGDSITALQGDVSTLEGTVSTQGSAITALQSGKVDKSNGMGLSTLMNLEAQSRTNTGTIIGALLLDKYGRQVTEIKLRNGIEVDSALSSESENPVQNKAVTTELEKKADADGNYEDMAVGQLLSNTFEEDKAPYNFRTSGGTLEIGDREYDTLVGGTVAFNQLVPNNYITLTETVNSDVETTVWGTTSVDLGSSFLSHKIFVKSVVSNSKCFPAWANSNTKFVDKSSGSVEQTNSYRVYDVTNSNYIGAIRFRRLSGLPAGTYTAYIQLIDLTQMFGSTIADYIYSLEQATAGSGVAYFRSLFPKDYYAYNAGQLMSVKALSHKMVGFNQWDEEWEVGTINTTTGQNQNSPSVIRSKNYIHVTPNTQYHSTYAAGYQFEYDADKNYIGTFEINTSPTSPNTHYIRFMCDSAYGTTYKNDICINLHWDGERDGEYEAYSEHIYPLDSDLELRGIPKLDANNQLYYDGDTYESDGTVTRKYAVVDLGSLYWESASTDTQGYYRFKTTITNLKMSASATDIPNLVCGKYETITPNNAFLREKNGITVSNSSNLLLVYDSAYAQGTSSAFKTAMSGVYLVYELATPTTETADTFENPQLVDNWGTEEYTDSREVQIPVGHITKYPPDLKAKLESAPDSPSANGDYILRHNNGVNSYVALTKELPAVPTTDGTYVLKSTVSSGVATLSWVAE